VPSRGKGSRRSPGRDGGARRQRRVTVAPQARHAVESREALQPPRVALSCGSHERPASFVYRLDVEMAKRRVPYHIAVRHTKDGTVVIVVTVSESHRPHLESSVEMIGGWTWPWRRADLSR
jgi:hypothetical protein